MKETKTTTTTTLVEATSSMWLRWLVIAFSVLLWSTFLDRMQQVVSVVYSASFSVIEYCWAKAKKRHYRQTAAEAHYATWQQFYVLALLAIPFFFNDHDTEPVMNPTCGSIIAFPFRVWLFEIVSGYYLQFLYNGRNPAWDYSTSNRGSCYCHGNIVLDMRMYFRWVGLGVLHYLLATLVLVPWLRRGFIIAAATTMQ